MYNTDKKPYPIISFDFETSGLPEEGGRPIQFAALLVDPYTLHPVAQNGLFSVYMKLEEGEEINPEAAKVNGITKEFLEEHGVSRDRARLDFYGWLESHGFNTPLSVEGRYTTEEEYKKLMYSQFVGLGQNLNFDLFFMDFWIGRKLRNMFHFKYIDLLPIAELINTAMQLGVGFDAMPFRHPETDLPAVSLVAQAHAFDIKVDGAHDAAEDVLLAAGAYRCHVETLAGTFRAEFNSNQTPEALEAAKNAAAATGTDVDQVVKNG